MDKLVSIVLPVYNGEKYLEQSIESVLNQTYRNIELIIVNDCSDDSSEEIILKYKAIDNRVIYIKNAVNSKLPQSLNNGFAVANGEYFTWTSDDNIYHLNAIETMVSFLNKHLDVGLVYCDFNVINESGEFKYLVEVGDPDQQLYANLVGACFLYRRDVAKCVGEYDPSLFLVEDYEYWLRINLQFRIAPLHNCLYDYRWHERSLTLTRTKEIHDALEKLQWKYLGKYESSSMEKYVLFDYFDFLVNKKENKRERVWLKLVFSIKHINYFKKNLKTILKRQITK